MSLCACMCMDTCVYCVYACVCVCVNVFAVFVGGLYARAGAWVSGYMCMHMHACSCVCLHVYASMQVTRSMCVCYFPCICRKKYTSPAFVPSHCWYCSAKAELVLYRSSVWNTLSRGQDSCREFSAWWIHWPIWTKSLEQTNTAKLLISVSLPKDMYETEPIN